VVSSIAPMEITMMRKEYPEECRSCRMLSNTDVVVDVDDAACSFFWLSLLLVIGLTGDVNRSRKKVFRNPTKELADTLQHCRETNPDVIIDKLSSRTQQSGGTEEFRENIIVTLCFVF